jgi:hypothetical protein
MLHDPSKGVHFYDDFIRWAATTTNAETDGPMYFTSLDDGCLFTQDQDTDFGAIETTGNDAANDGSVLVYGNQAGFARFGNNSADKVWFEARFQVDTITDDEIGLFLGFGEVNVEPTASATLVDTTVVLNTTEDFVGFLLDSATDAGGGALLECVYQERGQTKIDVGDAIASGTFAATTSYKVGMKYNGAGDGTSGSQGTLEYYVNGAVVQTLDVTSSLNFPDANHLAMMLAHKNIDGGSNVTKLDWWRCAAVGGNI